MSDVEDCPAVIEVKKTVLNLARCLSQARRTDASGDMVAAIDTALHQSVEALRTTEALASCCLDLHRMVPEADRDKWHAQDAT